MRTKSFLALTVCALALTACSSTQVPEEAAPAATSTATPEAEPSRTASADPEEAFIAAVETQVEGKEDVLASEMPAEKLTEEYWLERGTFYCDEYEKGRNEMPDLESATEGQFEIVLMGASIGTLCPAQAN